MPPIARRTRPLPVLAALALAGCGGGGGGAPSQVLPPAPAVTAPTVQLSATPASVTSGSAAQLTWSSTGAASCSASGGWSGTRDPSGTASTGPLTATATFTMTCTNAGGSTAQSTTVTVTAPPPPPPPPTVTITASPTSVAPGGSSTLTWSSTNATSCVASGGWSGTRATSGSAAVGPISATTSYFLSCTGAGGSTNQGATVAVAGALTLSGNLLVPSFSQADGDTNDSLLTPVRNDTFGTAQALPTPVLLGGYATVPGAGESGPLRTGGDVSDYYRVTLLANQVIELTVANEAPATNDLDLELYTASQTLSRSSDGTGRTERITVPTAGDYFVRVVAFGGASNYVLSIGQSSATGAVASAEPDIVPGEAIVALRGAPAKGIATLAAEQRALAGAFDLAVAGGAPDRAMLMRLGPGTAAAIASLSAGARETGADADGLPDGARFADEAQAAKWRTAKAIKALRAHPSVAWAEPNHRMRAFLVPGDPLYGRQRWHYELISLPAAWNVTTGGSAPIVAVVDTGVRAHADLPAPRLVYGYDFVSGTNNGDGNGRDADASDPGVPVGAGYVFHGTHVAGTIAAAGVPAGGSGQGGVGVSWAARIMPIRALGIDGSGTSFDIIQGIRYAARLPNDSGQLPAERADIVNLSLGGGTACPTAYQQVVNDVRAAGVIVVAAAGNEALGQSAAPASCNGVLSVAAVDAARQRAPYSNSGPDVDLAAPGGNSAADLGGDGFPDGVFSLHATLTGSTYADAYAYLQGTSMAAPHVAGVLALMKTVNPGLTPTQVDDYLASGQLTDALPGTTGLGRGLVNASKAVQAAQAAPTPRPGQLAVDVAAVNFGSVQATADVRVSNSGNQAVAVQSRSSSAAWLTVAPVAVDGSGLGSYRLTVNRGGLANGLYSGFVEFVGSVGTPVRVNVQMQVGGATAFTPDAGQQYVLLIDAGTDDTVGQAEVRARGASVAYTLRNVAPGRYFVVVGTDLDNDGFVCDDGEACGEYPVYGIGEAIDVSASRSGLDFTTEFRPTPATAVAADGLKQLAPAARGYARQR